jgi:hypothetical protein
MHPVVGEVVEGDGKVEVVAVLLAELYRGLEGGRVVVALEGQVEPAKDVERA